MEVTHLSKNWLTIERKLSLMRSAIAMMDAGIENSLARDAAHYAVQYRGIADLLEMWKEEHDAGEVEESRKTLADIADLISDITGDDYML